MYLKVRYLLCGTVENVHVSRVLPEKKKKDIKVSQQRWIIWGKDEEEIERCVKNPGDVKRISNKLNRKDVNSAGAYQAQIIKIAGK